MCRRNKRSLSETVEKDPLHSLSYILFLVQFMSMTLDLFMDTSVEPGWHYSITTIELLIALMLAVYQVVRMYALLGCSCCGGGGGGGGTRSTSSNNNNNKTKSTVFLALSSMIQFCNAGLAAYSYKYNLDAAEWSMFALSLVWGFINPMTYSSVAQVVLEDEAAAARKENEDEDDNDLLTTKKQKKRLGPMAAAFSIFTRHFMKTPLLFFFGTLMAIGSACLSTYQGAIVNELTKSVTKVDRETGRLRATADEVEALAFTLMAVWLSASVARFLLDLVSSVMFARLEVWLRDVVFVKAVESHGGSNKTKQTQGDKTTAAAEDDGGLSMADFQARYASDVSGVATLYASLLHGVCVNILLIITNFTFLAILDWKVAMVTLGFIVMGVVSGPTDLAGAAAHEVQDHVTGGLKVLGDIGDTEHDQATADGAVEGDGDDDLIQKHNQQVLEPLKSALFRQLFFSASVNSFVGFFTSYLTNIVVITMSWQVFDGTMDSSEFLGIFYVFKQLQKPATNISKVLKKVVSKTANLQRVDALVFGTSDNDKEQQHGGGGGAGADADGDETENEDQKLSPKQNISC